MSNISDLVTGIKSHIATASSYTESVFGYDLTDGSKYQSKERYQLLVLDTTEMDGVNKALTLDTTFEVLLMSTFLVSSSSDSAKRSLTVTLNDKMIDCFKRIIDYKCGAPSVVINIKGFSISTPEVIEDRVILRGNFIITHRIVLA